MDVKLELAPSGLVAKAHSCKARMFVVSSPVWWPAAPRGTIYVSERACGMPNLAPWTAKGPACAKQAFNLRPFSRLIRAARVSGLNLRFLVLMARAPARAGVSAERPAGGCSTPAVPPILPSTCPETSARVLFGAPKSMQIVLCGPAGLYIE